MVLRDLSELFSGLVLRYSCCGLNKTRTPSDAYQADLMLTSISSVDLTMKRIKGHEQIPKYFVVLYETQAFLMSHFTKAKLKDSANDFIFLELRCLQLFVLLLCLEEGLWLL